MRNALVGRQRGAALDLPDEQIEGALRVRLDQLELRERGRVLVGLDVVAVLYLVQPVRGRVFGPSIPRVAILKLQRPYARRRGRDGR